MEESEKEFEKNPSKEKFFYEIKRKCESEQPTIGESWLVQCLTHPSNKIALMGQSIAKELISSKSIAFLQ